MKKRISILGSTGSIGMNTLDVIARHSEQFSVYALTANRNVERLLQQCQQFKPEHVVIVEPQAATIFAQHAKALGLNCEIHQGIDALSEVAAAPQSDIVMAAIVGAAGLLSTLAAAAAGKRILLANKEALVITGELLINTARINGAEILPVDSEHNAIFQCLPPHRATNCDLAKLGVKRLILTASGGPFRNYTVEQLAKVTPEQACAHPNWKMGKKVSVDSASLMNKGLEIIEARWLFNAAIEQIEAVMQPQSIIHSMVEYLDGSVLAQLGVPDMRTPIAHVLGLPNRLGSGSNSLNFNDFMSIEFSPIELQHYPCLQLAYAALRLGGTASACLNAANEVAVAAFLQQQIGFLQIATIVEKTLAAVAVQPANDVETVLAVDAQARCIASELITA